MLSLQFFSDIAYAAVALLVAAVAVYLALRLLGKLAKFAIIAVVVAVVLWFVFSDHSIVQSALALVRGAKGG